MHIHRNKLQYPHEAAQVANHWIISAQTPITQPQGPRFFSSRGEIPGGSTGIELHRILSNLLFPASKERWIIVTGHNEEDNISGKYTWPDEQGRFNDPLYIIQCSIAELTTLIMQCGYHKGDQLNLLLYICHGALGDDSMAKQLARCLAEHGFSVKIVASKSAVGRFRGSYCERDNEKEGECLRYRVDQDKDIVAVSAIPSLDGGPSIIKEEENVYPNGFFITSYGLGDLSMLEKNMNKQAGDSTLGINIKLENEVAAVSDVASYKSIQMCDKI